MIWQDLVIAIASVVFVIVLSYQVYRDYKEKRSSVKLLTAVATAAGMYAIAFSFFTLGLIFSAAVATLTATLWLILTFQSIAYK